MFNVLIKMFSINIFPAVLSGAIASVTDFEMPTGFERNKN